MRRLRLRRHLEHQADIRLGNQYGGGLSLEDSERRAAALFKPGAGVQVTRVKFERGRAHAAALRYPVVRNIVGDFAYRLSTQLDNPSLASAEFYRFEPRAWPGSLRESPRRAP